MYFFRITSSVGVNAGTILAGGGFSDWCSLDDEFFVAQLHPVQASDSRVSNLRISVLAERVTEIFNHLMKNYSNNIKAKKFGRWTAL